MKHNWYVSKGSAGQGLIISEDTGETIAVSYKEENAKLLTAAPDLVRALQECFTEDGSVALRGCGYKPAMERRLREINRIVEEATRAFQQQEGYANGEPTAREH